MAARSLLGDESNAVKLLQVLDENGFGPRIRSFRGIERRVDSLSVQELVKILERVAERYKFQPQAVTTPFTFVGTQELSGAASPCEAPRCRIAASDELGRFAALYADHVYVPNPLNSIFQVSDPVGHEAYFRMQVAIGFAVITKLRPLINAGLISFVEVENNGLCRSCFDRAWNEAAGNKPATPDLSFYLISRFAKEAKFTLHEILDDGKPVIHVSAPESLLSCGGFRATGRSLKDIGIEGQSVKLPMKLNNRSSAVNYITYELIEQIISDIRTQTTLTKTLGASYLTSREVDFDILDKFGLRSTKRARTTNRSIFAHSLPVVDQVSLTHVLKLRSHEGEAFQIYRQAVSRALDVTKSDKGKREQQIFEDLIQPELIKLDSTIRKSRKLLLNSTAQDLVVVAGTMAIGALATALPREIQAIGQLSPYIGPLLGAGGSVHYSKRLLQNVVKLCQESDDAINNRFYFLWKLRRGARQ
jgi:hypothetical protein